MKFYVGVIVILLMSRVDSEKILVVAPFAAISHFQMLEPLILNLSGKGHKITVISHFPQKNPVPNVTDIDLRGRIPSYELKFESWTLIDDVLEFFTYGNNQCRTFVESEKVQKFFETEEKFDLIFIEAFESDCCLGFAAKFKAPFILFSAMALPVWESDWIYNPTEPSYLPDNLCRLAGKMNFVEKLRNIGCHLFFRFLNWFESRKLTPKTLENLFHVNIDNLDDIKRNVSFIFVNSFHGITGVRPLLPNVIEIGGIHIKPSKQLPKAIRSFLTQSPHGVIVISMGSIIKSSTLDPKLRDGFLTVISSLKENVLWKWEVDFPEKPPNLMTVPWIPQSDVLGHPNVKMFISHGGIHGLFEAVYHGVPMLGIPLFGDQMANLKSLEAKGVAKVLDFSQLNTKTLSSCIQEILGNESYKENAKKLSEIFRDEVTTPLERATFWTEYVLRHRGAPHMRNGALTLSWFQYLLVDVLFVAFSFGIFIIVVFRYLLKFLRFI